MNVGTFKNPAIVPLPSVDRVVDEGVLISTSAVRMALKNELIIAALRDHHDYDPELMSRRAAELLIQLARENEETAERLDQPQPDPGIALSVGNAEEDALDELSREDHRRRPTIHRLLAAALRRKSADPDAIAALVTQSRVEAADEVGRATLRRVRDRDFGGEPGYALARSGRVRELIAVDFADLRRTNPPRE